MRESFAATIAFAVLTLFMVFLAHLAGFAFAGEPQHAWGLLVTILAAAVSYAAQHDYTHASVWLAHHQQTTAPGYAGPADPDAFQNRPAGCEAALQAMAAACPTLSGY